MDDEGDRMTHIVRDGVVNRVRRQGEREANNSANLGGPENASVDEDKQKSSRSSEESEDGKPNLELHRNRNCISSDQVLALLVCPICPPGALLQRPTTLRCGHSICQSHVLNSDNSPVSLSLTSPTASSTSSTSAASPVQIPPVPPVSPVSPVSRLQSFHCPVASCSSSNPSSGGRNHPTVELLISTASNTSNASNATRQSGNVNANANATGSANANANANLSASNQKQPQPIDVRLSQILSLVRESSRPHRDNVYKAENSKTPPLHASLSQFYNSPITDHSHDL